jgi:hypothetical protein
LTSDAEEAFDAKELSMISPKIRLLTFKIVNAVEKSKIHERLRTKSMIIFFLIENTDPHDAWFVGVDSFQAWKYQTSKNLSLKSRLQNFSSNPSILLCLHLTNS